MGPSLIVVTRGATPFPELLASAEATGTPLAVSQPRSSGTIATLHNALDDILAPRESVHGVLVQVHGVGVLLTGPSGIGKSETALALVERGHRLIADDNVLLTTDAQQRDPRRAAAAPALPHRAARHRHRERARSLRRHRRA
jgi:HPr kinase/phosphorylase